MFPVCGRSLLLVICGSLLIAGNQKALSGGKEPTHAIIPPFERFYAKEGGDAVKGGQLLLGELNCISCHKPEAAQEPYLSRRQAPILDGVGNRVRRTYLRKFLTDPQGTKPGTPMPHVLENVAEQDKASAVEALVHFLANTGSLPQERPDKKAIALGRDLYSRVGCVACHGTRDAAGNQAKLFATSVPLGDLKAKYSLNSLRVFLENPHVTRPSARMPGILNAKEAQEVANFLLQGIAADSFPPNLAFAYFEGSWANVPDFSKLPAKAKGQASGFDLTLASRSTNFGLQFEGFLRIDREGDYRLHLTSDDGSKLYLNDKLAVNNDGVHAPATKTGTVKLTKGMHKLRVGMFNGGGGAELGVEIEGPGLGRQSIVPYLFLTPEPTITKKEEIKGEDNFSLQPELVKQGQELFATLGCASCHQLQMAKKNIVSQVKVPELAKLRPEGGCLAKTPSKGAPRYALSQAQHGALTAALKTQVPTTPLTPPEIVTRTLTTFNCYACHQRDKFGGVEEKLDPFFTTSQQEMGDEGRIPPSLTGVGAKLTTHYLQQVLDKGAHDRPYMHTRMPKFGNNNVGHLVKLFGELDSLPDVPAVSFNVPLAKVKAEARHIVGAQALGCIKCHTFAGNKAEGVQGIDMTIMTDRVQRDWFHLYLLDPNKFRPQTRMPTAWPNGNTLLPKILEGDTKKQIESIWVYLSEGKKANLPVGVKKQFLPLIPDKSAIVFRNFLEGSGSRAIGVGYPEKAHLAFDANNMRLAMLWQGAFLDAARHWTDRGSGYEPPLGDNILQLPEGVAFAVLPDAKDPWPIKSAKGQGYRFLGYRLTEDDRPTFLYALGEVKIEDFPNAVASKETSSIVRTLTLHSDQPMANLYFRAAVANKIQSLGNGWYGINEWKMRLDAPAQIRTSEGKMELLVPVSFKGNQVRIVQEFVW